MMEQDFSLSAKILCGHSFMEGGAGLLRVKAGSIATQPCALGQVAYSVDSVPGLPASRI